MYPKNISGDIYLSKDKNENTRITCETYSKLTIKTTERSQCRYTDVLFLTLNRCHTLQSLVVPSATYEGLFQLICYHCLPTNAQRQLHM